MNSTQTILLNLGVSPAAKGYKYLIDAINYQVEHNNDFVKVCWLYNTIAKNHNVKATSVERCIRACIENCSLKSVNQAWWHHILGEYNNGKRAIPCNKDFICIVAQYIINKEVK